MTPRAAIAAAATRNAQQWRSDHGYAGKGGVIIVFGHEIQGWVCELRNPEHWRPGIVAVAEDGTCHEARGGNDRDGAECWEPLP